MEKGEVHRGEHRERPELIFDEHRPPGSPQPREVKSQKAQLESGHRHGVQNDVHLHFGWPGLWESAREVSRLILTCLPRIVLS
ncbi:MAG: hypothetical protein KJ650_04975 [Firmicutes bacterium]|nr:hypothetical protein [Bacillota bacterium]MBV1727979.1 hypothetical protein [Desulforudis sp.]MBU4532980.1 hypothetical protein [Bacillota bacterium]MBU4553913.1 hypothetical protein [Bacillota bacterium]MBV1735003.1 hypothetical protein [Desulforudis sp.]